MAVTKIWPVKGRIEQPIAYAINPKKTDKTLWAGDASIEDVIGYASNSEKPKSSIMSAESTASRKARQKNFAWSKNSFKSRAESSAIMATSPLRRARSRRRKHTQSVWSLQRSFGEKSIR